MIRVIGYTPEGQKVYSDNVPAYARVPGHGGSLQYGAPGPNDAAVRAARLKASRAAQEKAS